MHYLISTAVAIAILYLVGVVWFINHLTAKHFRLRAAVRVAFAWPYLLLKGTPEIPADGDDHYSPGQIGALALTMVKMRYTAADTDDKYFIRTARVLRYPDPSPTTIARTRNFIGDMVRELSGETRSATSTDNSSND